MNDLLDTHTQEEQERVTSPPTEESELEESMQAQWLFTMDEFGKVAEGWDSLIDQCRLGGDGVHAFLYHGWLAAHLCHLEGKSALRIVVLKKGERLVAAAPLVLQKRRRLGKVPLPGPLRVRVLSTPATSHTPRGGWLLGNDPEASINGLWRKIQEEPDWEIMEIKDLPIGSSTHKRLVKLALKDGLMVGEWTSMNSPYIRLPAPNPEGKFGRELRRRIRKLEELGEVEFEQMQTGSQSELDEALMKGLMLEASGWKGKSGTAILCDDKLHNFYREVTSWAAAKGWLRLDFLNLNKKPIGFHLSLCEGGKHFLLKPGFDPELACYGPGHILLWMVLQRLTDCGIIELDLMGDDASWKQQWSQRARGHVWLHIFRPSWKTKAIYNLKYGRGKGLSNLLHKKRP